jgi:Nucleoside recognition
MKYGDRQGCRAGDQAGGFNWKIGIGLITSLAGREVIVGTLGTIYSIEQQNTHGLQAALRGDLLAPQEHWPSGVLRFRATVLFDRSRR